MRNTFGVRRSDRVRNSLIGERCGCEFSLMKLMERKVFKWFGNMERMVNEVFRVCVGDNKGRMRPQRRWIDG